MFKLIFIILALVSLSGIFYAQDDIDIEKGKKYKFTLIDDTEINGKVIDSDSRIIKVQTKDDIVTIFKDKIIYAASDLTPYSYKYSFALTGGASFQHEFHQESFHLNMGGMYYLSKQQAIKVDLGVSFLDDRFHGMDYNHHNPDPPPQNQGPGNFHAGNSVLITFKPSFVLGQLEPAGKTLLYGYGGVGFTYFHRNEMHHPDNSDPNIIPPDRSPEQRSEFSGILGIGGGLGFKVSPHLSILTEAEVNVLTSHNFESYIPVRVGLSYFVF
jgi:hypothetical protein